MVLAVCCLACGDPAARDGGAPQPLDAGEDAGASRVDAGAPADADADAGAYVPEQYVDVREVDGLSLPDAIGSRTLPLLVRFAADARQPLPVVIWEHAGGYNPTGHRLGAEWSRTLARAGYLVVHIGHVAPSAQQLVELCRAAGLTLRSECVDLSLQPGGTLDEELDLNIFSSVAVARPADVRQALDALPQLAQRLAALEGITLDARRVAVAGWSGGSQAPTQLAGALRHVSASLPAYRDVDPRPVAFVALSPQGPGYSGYFAPDGGPSSWDAVRGPMLVVTGDSDEKPANTLTGPVRRLAYEHMPAGDKHLWYSHLADPLIAHGSFNLGALGESDPELLALTDGLAAVVVGFLDAKVKGLPEAQAWLSSDAPAATAPGLIDWLHP